jgi:hypothetical protein
VLARFIHLKNEKLVNVELKSPSLKNKECNNHFSSAAKVKQGIVQDVFERKQFCLGL